MRCNASAIDAIAGDTMAAFSNAVSWPKGQLMLARRVAASTVQDAVNERPAERKVDRGARPMKKAATGPVAAFHLEQVPTRYSRSIV